MTPTMLQRLLRHPHAAVFDKNPGAEIAFRINHPSVASWQVADEVLTVTFGVNPANARTITLHDKTLMGVSLALQALGYQVTDLPSTIEPSSALVLIEGEGSQSVSNGDALSIHTSLLWSLLGGYAGELSDASKQIVQALRQMIITQAEDVWLDLWGTLYATPRKSGEIDATYAARIPREAFRPRNNARAIEMAILDETGKVVAIEEPWMDIFVLDESTLSGHARFYDGETIGYHLIRPTSKFVIDWTDVMPVIERNRSAGIIVLQPQLGSILYLSAELSSQHWTDGQTWVSAAAPWEDINVIIASSYTRS